MTWKIHLVVNDERRQLWGAERDVVVHKGVGESRDHVILKVLGTALFFHEGLVVEDPRRIGRYKSDVSRWDDRGDVQQWIECGLVSPYKLDRLTRALGPGVTVEVLKKGKAAAIALRQQLDEEDAGAAHPERVHVNAVHAELVDDISAALASQERTTWVITVQETAEDEAAVAVDVAGVSLCGPVLRIRSGARRS